MVTRQLKRWHAVHTLEIVYRDAFNNQLNDRYQPKFLEYQRAGAERAGAHLSLRRGPGADSDSAGADAGVQRRGGSDSRRPRTMRGRRGWEHPGRRESRVMMTTYDAPAGSLPVVQMIESSGGGDGVQRLSGADAGCAGIAESDTGSGGAEFHAGGHGTGGGCSAGRRASSRHLYQRRLDAAAGLKRWPRQEASRRARWWSS